MQLNKQRQRRIQQNLHKSLPADGSSELAIWERNRKLSPLLRLPPELRNRIYDLVLRVGQINVCYAKWEHRKRFRKGVPYYETKEGGFWCRILRREQNPWPGSPFKVEPPHGMTLLSPVCRQLYHETALLPYSVNTWSFQSRFVMDRYIVKEKRLPVSHRRAIRILYSQGVLTVALEKYFGGLEVVLLEGGVKMTKHIIDSDPEHAGRKTIAWDVSSPWWKPRENETRSIRELPRDHQGVLPALPVSNPFRPSDQATQSSKEYQQRHDQPAQIIPLR